jgi:F420-non-reducing hydrogenase small subunit
MISALASVLGLDDEEALPDAEVEKLLDDIVDPVGTFYKYGLATALLNRRLEE